MNDKGKEIGLENTHFVNTTGLHDPEHYSCAKDMARIAQVLIQTGGDQLLAITSTYDTYIREDSDQQFWLVNQQADQADGGCRRLKNRFYPGSDELYHGYRKTRQSSTDQRGDEGA